MIDPCALQQIRTDTEYCAVLDALEQLADAPDAAIRDVRLRRLSALIEDYESRVAAKLAGSMAALETTL
jgi:hypothetical protein